MTYGARLRFGFASVSTANGIERNSLRLPEHDKATETFAHPQ